MTRRDYPPTMVPLVAKSLLVFGLAACGVALALLDRGWMKDLWEPVGPIDHPIAAVVAVSGLLCFAGGNLLLKRLRSG